MKVLELAALLLGTLGAAVTGRDASKDVRVQELEGYILRDRSPSDDKIQLLKDKESVSQDMRRAYEKIKEAYG